MVRSGKGQTEASVTLAAGDRLFEGRSQGPAGHSHRARLVAIATLDAVAELLGQACEVESSTVVADRVTRGRPHRADAWPCRASASRC